MFLSSESYSNKLPRDPKFQVRDDTMSFVVREVDEDIEEGDVSDAILHQYQIRPLLVKRFTRARPSGERLRTRTVQIVMPKKLSNNLTVQGLKLFGALFNIEVQKNIRLADICHRCQFWGHKARWCRREPKCLHCAGPHLTANCHDIPWEPICANCRGDHKAFDVNCPVYQKFPPNKSLSSPSRARNFSYLRTQTVNTS